MSDAVLDHLIGEMAVFLNDKAGADYPKKAPRPQIKDEMPIEKPSKLDALFGDL